MQRPAVPIALAIIFLALMVFYLIPGISHPLVFSNPMHSQVKHGILFAGLALLSLIWARFAMNPGR
jgi:hypothetical protein